MSDTVAPIGLFDRAIRRIATVWRDMAAGVTPEGDESIAAQMRACLDGRGGEVSARNRAAKLAQAYLALGQTEKVDLLRQLAAFDSDPEAVAQAYAAVQDAPDPAARASAKANLRRTLEPPRVRLLTQFTTIPDGMKFLVDLRGTLLDHMEGDDLLAGARERSAHAARELVRCRLPRAAPHRLVEPGLAAREARLVRGGAPHPLLARPQEPARQRPPLLRLLPSAHAARSR